MAISRLMRRQVRTLAGASLTTSYQAVGLVVTIAAYKISIVNSTTTDLTVIDQTTNDAFYLPAGSSISVGEGLSGSGQPLDRMASVPSQTVYMAKLPSGVAGTGILVITVEGY